MGRFGFHAGGIFIPSRSPSPTVPLFDARDCTARVRTFDFLTAFLLPVVRKGVPMEDKFSEGGLLPVGGSAGSQFAQCAQESGGGSGIIKRVKGDRRRELWRFRPETNL